MNTPWHIQLLGALRAETGGRVVARFRTRQAGVLLARLALFPDRAHAREELIDLLWPDADLDAGRNRLRVALASLRRQLEPPGVPTGSVLIADRAHVRLNPAASRCDAVEFERLARAGRSADARLLYAGELLPGFYDDWVQDERERLDALYEGLCGREATGTPARPAAALPSSDAPTAPSLRLHGVPLPLSRFFGREDEQTRLAGLLADPDTRLVTLSGPGGAGKTRLAVEAARAATGGPVFWVGLADLDDARLIPAALAGVMGLAPATAREPLDVVADALMEAGPALLVLDNLEHLVDRGALVVQSLLTRVPTLTCLVTSRRRLAVPGEREMPLGPLSLPPPGGTAEQVAASDSARLFVDRAQAARPDFQVTARNAGDLAALCQDLEGLPLALELAAARAGALGVGEMRQKLAQRFAWLASQRTDKNARHRSLWAALAWSYDLLPPASQRFFAQLSVFRGGCTVEAAQAVCVEPQALESLTQLRERSLALVEDGAGAVRFRLPESVREFGAEQLSPDERTALAARHAQHCLALARQGQAGMAGPEQAAWLDRLDAEHDNLRAALDWGVAEGGDAEAGLRLAVAVWRFWYGRGHLREGRERLTALLERVSDTPQMRPHRAGALNALGTLNLFLGDKAAARAALDAGLHVFQSLGDRAGEARVLNNRGLLAGHEGDHAGAWADHEASLAIKRALGDRRGIPSSLNNLGGLARDAGDHAQARDLFTKSLAISRELGDAVDEAHALNSLGNVESATGDADQARASYQASLRIKRGLGDRQGVAVSLSNLGGVALRQEDWEGARGFLAESLELFRTLGVRHDVGSVLNDLGRAVTALGDCRAARAHLTESLTIVGPSGHAQELCASLESFAALAAAEAMWERAAVLLGAAGALREARGAPLAPSSCGLVERTRTAARDALGDDVLRRACERGRSLTASAAVEVALRA